MIKLDLSIIIVNYNTRELLKNCIESINRCTNEIKYEIIVVDNKSGDGSAEMLEKNFPETILIKNRENKGYATANNQGIDIAKGRYLLILNSDMLFFEDALSKTVNFADDHPEAGIIGCRMLNGDKSLQESTFMFPSILNLLLSITYLSNLFPGNRFFGRERMGWWDWNEVKEVEVITGCFMLVRKNAMDEVGKMDDQFFMYFEETDWCYRFKKAGWEVMFTPVGEVIHYGGGSSKKMPDKLLLQLYSSMLLYFKKHYGFVVYILTCFLLSVFFLSRIPYWIVRSFISKDTRRSDFKTVLVYVKGMFKTLLGWRGLRMNR